MGGQKMVEVDVAVIAAAVPAAIMTVVAVYMTMTIPLGQTKPFILSASSCALKTRIHGFLSVISRVGLLVARPFVYFFDC